MFLFDQASKLSIHLIASAKHPFFLTLEPFCCSMNQRSPYLHEEYTKESTTNSIENRRLYSENYLKRVASGIVKGIDLYIKDMELAHKGG